MLAENNSKVKDCKHPTCGDGPCRREKKPKKKYVIPKVAEKRKVLDQLYFLLRTAFLKEHKECEIQSPVCTGKATCVHHTKGRGRFYLVVATWMASCKWCNGYVEKHDAWAREKGFKKSKFEPGD